MQDNDPSGTTTSPSLRPVAPLISPDRQRRFERARRSAMALCPGLWQYGPRPGRWADCVVDSRSVERYRLLIAAMGVARATPGGDAIAGLAQRGYLIVLTTALSRSARVHRIDTEGVVWCGAGLPTRGSPWCVIERHALRVDPAEYPALRFVSAHESLRIRHDLRQEGHDLG